MKKTILIALCALIAIVAKAQKVYKYVVDIKGSCIISSPREDAHVLQKLNIGDTVILYDEVGSYKTGYYWKAKTKKVNGYFDMGNTTASSELDIFSAKMDSIIHLNEENELFGIQTKSLSSLIKKYGKYYGKLIYNQKVVIGMTKAMVKDALGEPDDINRTVNVYSITEQWVYHRLYCYFTNGKLTSWQD
jgi:hypothetical protein